MIHDKAVQSLSTNKQRINRIHWHCLIIYHYLTYHVMFADIVMSRAFVLGYSLVKSYALYDWPKKK